MQGPADDHTAQYDAQRRILGGISGVISKVSYDWAVETIQCTYFESANSSFFDAVVHARWIIDRVHDGTLTVTERFVDKECIGSYPECVE